MSKYPNTYYRVSVKALIRDADGKLLVCKENSPNWSLPGGGVDHGEEPLEALKRELHEELGITAYSNAQIADVLTVYVEEKEAWLMWVVFAVELPQDVQITPGADVTEYTFIDPAEFKHSTQRAAIMITKVLEGAAAK